MVVSVPVGDEDASSTARRIRAVQWIRDFERGDIVQRALLAASAIEAFFLLMMLGYGPLYLHQEFHAPAVVASLAAAGPSLATFVGSTWWGHQLRHVGIGRVASIGLAAYLGTGLVAFFAPSAAIYIAGITVTTMFSSALAPATLTFLTYQGGSMGGRLASRLKWQSGGWMVGGLAGGYVQSLFHRAFPLVLLGLAVVMLIPLFAARRASEVAPSDPTEQRGGRPSHLGLIVLLVLPFFLAYAGNEGFFTNFALYLHGVHVPTNWVGWSAAISTGLGWALASSIGRWADRFGGKQLLIRVLLGYTLMYVIMSVTVSQVIVIVAFSLPLYPLLNIGIQRAAAEALPGRLHGSAMGIVNGAAGLATFGGSVVMGTVITLAGPHGMPWAAAGFVGLGLLVAIILYRKAGNSVLREI